MKRKICVAVSAMIVACQLGSPAAAEEPDVEQLAAISDYLDSNNVAALRAYLLLYPDLLEGSAPLANLLRDFMRESADIASFLGVDPRLREDVIGAARTREPEVEVTRSETPQVGGEIGSPGRPADSGSGGGTVGGRPPPQPAPTGSPGLEVPEESFPPDDTIY